MKKVSVILADGFEEVEGLTVVDLLRRARIYVDTVSIMEDYTVHGAHGINVQTEDLFEEVNFVESDMIVLPGGMPGTKNLEAHEPLMKQIDTFYARGRYIAAICAAPSIFGHRGILKGRNACSYPSFESHLEGASVTEGAVEISDHVITSRGMGTAIDFGLAVAGVLGTPEKAEEIAKAIVYKQ